MLLRKLKEKGLKLSQAQQLIQFMRECDEVMFWISDKVILLINLTPRALMSPTVAILCFYWHLYNQLLKANLI